MIDKTTFILILLTHMTISKGNWTVSSLLRYTKETPIGTSVINPDLILASQTVNHIETKIAAIEELSINFIIVDSALNSYNDIYGPKPDLLPFLQAYINGLMLDGNKANNSLFIMYSIQDRLYAFFPGNLAKKFMPNSYLESQANKIKPHLKDKKYNLAFETFFDELTPQYNVDNTGIFIMGAVLFLFFILIIVCLMVNSNNTISPHDAKVTHIKKQFKTLQELRISGKDVNLFIQENCAVCLEKLDDQHKLNMSQSTNDINEVFLTCGHNFHEGCIKLWLKNDNNCPICRQTGISVNDSPDDNMHITLQQIQRTIYSNDLTYEQMDAIISVLANVIDVVTPHNHYNNVDNGDCCILVFECLGECSSSGDCCTSGFSGSW